MKIKYCVNQYSDYGEWLDDHGVFDNVDRAIDIHRKLVLENESSDIYTIEVFYFEGNE